MLKIIDTHQHLWDTSNLEYPWLEGFDLLGKRYTAEDYREAIGTLTSSDRYTLKATPPKRMLSKKSNGSQKYLRQMG